MGWGEIKPVCKKATREATKDVLWSINKGNRKRKSDTDETFRHREGERSQQNVTRESGERTKKSKGTDL